MMMTRRGAFVTILTMAFATLVFKFIRKRKKLYARYITIPPVLAKKPHKVPFGAVQGENRGLNPMTPVIYREDPYFWMRDETRTNKEVISYLEKENSYCSYKMQHLEETVSELYNELLSHVQEDDISVPFRYGPYMYYTRTIKGSSYKIHCRKRNLNSPEQVILDENLVAENLTHCDIRSVEPSPDHKLLAYSIDTNGDEVYSIFIKNIETGEFLPEIIEKSVGSLEWGKDNSSIYYTTPDAAFRSHKIWRHILGTPVATDKCLYTEDDELFSLSVSKTRSGRFVFILSSTSEETEYRYIDLEKQEHELQTFQPRQKDLLYYLDHHEDKFYILTNKDGATNFKLMSCATSLATTSNKWLDEFQYDSSMKLDEVMCFADFLVLYGRQDGFTQLWIVDHKKGGALKRLKFEDEVYYVHPDVNLEYQTSLFRFRYSSMVSPTSTYDYDVFSGAKAFLKESPCPNYDRSLYDCKRMQAIADDGTAIPISLVYRKDLLKQGPNPLHLYGYGSYEITVEPRFLMSCLPLLDRGMIFAIAHIRGGGALGRSWYEDAKYLNKIKTFTDFISCAEHLISTGMTTSSMMSIEGRSAGGLLMGVVLNMAPQLFRVALAGVPFVDVMNTMSDATIPLTTGEWVEWGNPNEKEFYDYMEKYSPYDNVKAQDYPSILITAGLYDPRVQYWEPAKWCAKLREMKTDQNLLLLKTDLTSGHFSASDRYRYLKEKAFELAFLLDQLGLLSKATCT